MDRITKIQNYQNIVQTCLKEEANISIDEELATPSFYVEDDNRFIVLSFGWLNKKYLHFFVYHVELIDDKVFIHEDRGDTGLANTLIQNGIKESDIILSYIPDYQRDNKKLEKIF